MIRVLLADDHPFVRRGVRETLEDAGIVVVAEAGDGDEALRLVRALGDRVDIAVVDLSMPGPGGLEVVSRLVSEKKGFPVLVLSMLPTEGTGVQAMEAGAMGYLSKRDAPDQIVDAVRIVATGRRYVSDALAETIAERAFGGPLGATLSVRELQVVRAVAGGLNRAKTASLLGLAPTTISAYKARAKEKVGVVSDAELVRYAVRNGLAD